MDFVFTGFRQNNNVRQYAFDGIAADRTRTKFIVGADLALIRKYAIAMQELPLLCLRLLERRNESDQTRTLMSTEEDMRGYASDITAAKNAAALKKKAPRRPASSRAGEAWRAPQTRI